MLVALVYLYVSAGVSLWGSWHTSKSDWARVASLERRNATLTKQRARLAKGPVIEAEARRLGFAHPGEETFVVRGLPKD